MKLKILNKFVFMKRGITHITKSLIARTLREPLGLFYVSDQVVQTPPRF